MKFDPPGVEDLKSVASGLGYSLDDDTARAILGFAGGFTGSFEYLASQREELPPVGYPERSFRKPEPEENPLGAWQVITDSEGNSSGALLGKRIAIKDNIFVAGVPMQNGTAFLNGFMPDFDASVVTRVLDAGARITGKAACEYLCVSGGSATSASGIVSNPVAPEYSAGGSSSGSAALVGAGAVDMALGCDQAGSVRIPSSWSGTVGMKPTHGLVPYTGILGMESTLDYCGPITANVADNALLLEVIAGADGYDGRQRDLKVHRYTDALGRAVRGMRIGLLSEGFGHALSEPDVDACVRAGAQRLEALGAEISEVPVPLHPDGVSIWSGVISDGLSQTLRLDGQGYNTEGVYSPAFCEAMHGWQARLDEFPINALMLVLLGRYLERYRGRFYVTAKNLVRRLRADYDAALSRVDLLVLPTTLMKAIRNPSGQSELSTDQIMTAAFNTILNTCQFDITGHPAMSLPCGMREGRPVGMMFVSRHWNEPAIYRAAHALEQSGDWRGW
jgi:amidase